MVQGIKRLWSFLTYLLAVFMFKIEFLLMSKAKGENLQCSRKSINSTGVIILQRDVGHFYCIYITFCIWVKESHTLKCLGTTKINALEWWLLGSNLNVWPPLLFINNNTNHMLLSPSLFVRLMVLDRVFCGFLLLTHIISITMKIVLKVTKNCYCGHDWVF